MRERIDRLFAAMRKRKEEKNDLLQCYFTSLMSLVLCVSMFLGTSYAWFTSEVNNVGNEIYIGVLDVGLEKQSGEEWKSLSELTEEGVNTTKLFDGGIRWEPGYTTLETVRVVNEGELAFKYVLQFTDGSAAKGTEQETQTLELPDERSLMDVAGFFDVWVYDHKIGEMPELTSFDDICEENGWVNPGSLADLLAGTSVLQGQMSAEEIAQAEAAQLQAGHTYTIALHMLESAESYVMGYKISMNVKLVAYQMSAESDAFGDDAYDSVIDAVSDPAGLNSALANGGNALLTVNMEIGEEQPRVTMNGGVLDGNDKTITYTVTKEEDEPSLGVVTTTGGIVRNLTIDGGTAGRALYVTNLTSDLLVSNCTLSGVYAFNLNSAERTNFNLSFVRTTFKSWTSYANVMKQADFVECTFEDVLRPYGNTVLTDCVFTEDSLLDLSELESGATVNLVNCTIDGVSGINATLRAEDSFAYVEHADHEMLVTGRGEVILTGND